MIRREQVLATRDDVSIPTLLFAVLGPPVLWAAHLTLAYFLLTLDCISPWSGGRWAITVSTVLFAAASAAAGVLAWRTRRRLHARGLPTSERGGITFLMALGIGGSMLFTAVIVLEGAAPYFTDLCA